MPGDEKRSPYFRGVGIHARGELRISNLGLTFDKTTGEISVKPATAHLRVDAWPWWLEIAEQHAEAAAELSEQTIGADDATFAELLGLEMKSSIQAVAAAAFALDAFYASTLEYAAGAHVQCDGRARRIAATLFSAYKLNNEQQKQARRTISEVFRFRDQAVHPPAAFSVTARHPVYGLGMEPRFVIFRRDNAHAAQRFARQLIWLCLHRPRSKYAELEQWAVRSRALINDPN